jgi:hypothetical protein
MSAEHMPAAALTLSTCSSSGCQHLQQHSPLNTCICFAIMSENYSFTKITVHCICAECQASQPMCVKSKGALTVTVRPRLPLRLCLFIICISQAFTAAVITALADHITRLLHKLDSDSHHSSCRSYYTAQTAAQTATEGLKVEGNWTPLHIFPGQL